MSLINCAAELKLNRTKHCALSGTGNTKNDIDNIIFDIRDT